MIDELEAMEAERGFGAGRAAGARTAAGFRRR